jgi:hypothetical protein
MVSQALSASNAANASTGLNLFMIVMMYLLNCQKVASCKTPPNRIASLCAGVRKTATG